MKPSFTNLNGQILLNIKDSEGKNYLYNAGCRRSGIWSFKGPEKSCVSGPLLDLGREVVEVMDRIRKGEDQSWRYDYFRSITSYLKIIWCPGKAWSNCQSLSSCHPPPLPFSYWGSLNPNVESLGFDVPALHEMGELSPWSEPPSHG